MKVLDMVDTIEPEQGILLPLLRMPAKGRPRLTAEEQEARVAEYCQRYGVTLNPSGLPPFPSGQRETQQHREWMAVYKAHHRLGRRGRGQCERCAAPTSAGSVFCERHRADVAARTGNHGASLEKRRALLAAQAGQCPICGRTVELSDSVDHSHIQGQVRAILHPRCNQLVALAEATGPQTLERVRAYLWPGRKTRPRP